MTPADTLKRELHLCTLIGSAALAGCFVYLALSHSLHIARHWLLFAALLWGWGCVQLFRLAPLNRADADAQLYASLGWGTRITVLRGWLIAVTGGFLLLSELAELAWIPALFYSIAAILDRVDGYLARRSRHTTLMGRELDTAFDALGLLVAPVLACLLGKVHWSYLLVSIAYYCFVAGIYWRRRHALPVHPLHPSKLRRTLAGFQMGFVAVALWPCIQAQASQVAGFAFMLPLLAGFVVDWLVTSGRIMPQQRSTVRCLSDSARFSHRALQPALRIILMLAVVNFSFIQQPGLHVWSTETILVCSLLACAMLILLGLAARLAALVLIVVFAALYPVLQIDLVGIVIIFSAVWILILGAGAFSLWQGDDIWVNRQDGSP